MMSWNLVDIGSSNGLALIKPHADLLLFGPLTHWPLGDVWVILKKKAILRRVIQKKLGLSLWNCSQVNATKPHWWKIAIGSGHGLVSPGNKPLPVSVFIIFVSPYGVTRPQWVMTKIDHRFNYQLSVSTSAQLKYLFILFSLFEMN